jgi:DNA-binding Lrp family transcriptional regulator
MAFPGNLLHNCYVIDEIDQQIVTLLLEDGRRSYGDIGRRVSLSAPSVKRRVDALRARGAITGFTARLDPAVLGQTTEAFVELFFAPGTQLDEVAERLRAVPEVVEAWSVTGDADAIARVRTASNADLEGVIRRLQLDGSVRRTRSQIALSQLVGG